MTIHRCFIHASASLALFFGAAVGARGQERAQSAPEVYPSSNLKAQETMPSLSGVAEPAQETRPAEPVDTLALPARVRLTMTNGDRLTFEALRLEPGRIIVRAFGGHQERDIVRAGTRLSELERDIPLAEVRTAMVSRGHRGNARKGFFWGWATGLIPGMVLASCCEERKPIATIIFGGILVALPVAGIGAGIGALVKTDRWDDVPISSLHVTSEPVNGDREPGAALPDRQVNFSIAPTHDRGVQARLSITWR